MYVLKTIGICAVLVLLGTAIVLGQSGSGDFKLGWVFLDEVGNRSVSHSSFNYYDGPVLSLENFRYRFANGIQVRSSLRNLTLQNRNLALDISNPGKYGADFRYNRSRRFYDFDGDNQTKRDFTAVNVWAHPVAYVKVFAGGSFNSVTGRVGDLFDASSQVFSRDVDYDGTRYEIGARVKYEGRMFHAEYNKLTYADNHDRLKDQNRKRIKLFAYAPVPGYEWIVLTGAYQRFQTEYDVGGNRLISNTGKGGILANLPHNFSLNYVGLFNRAGSDSDFVKTDNVAHLFYASYTDPGLFGITIGYQRDVNDDFEDAVNANSYYLSGHVNPDANSRIRLEYGRRAEDVDDGARLVGNEDRNRFKLYGTYNFTGKGTFGAGVETKKRENDQLESEAEFTRLYLETAITGIEYFMFTGGFSYAKGDYENPESAYSFDTKQFHFSATSKEYRNFTGGFSMTYFRNEKDLDTEGIDMLVTGSYRFAKDYRGEITYKVFNFDDFLAMDQYYTENIVEINLIKSFSL